MYWRCQESGSVSFLACNLVERIANVKILDKRGDRKTNHMALYTHQSPLHVGKPTIYFSKLISEFLDYHNQV